MSHRANKVGGSSTPFGFFIGIGAGDLGSRVILNEDLARLYGLGSHERWRNIVGYGIWERD
jgi:hypothetical protein